MTIYAIGHPFSYAINEPNRFQVGDRVTDRHRLLRCYSRENRKMLPENRSDNYMVIMTRMLKTFRRQPPTPQVMLDALPGQWFAAGHFDKEQ